MSSWFGRQKSKTEKDKRETFHKKMEEYGVGTYTSEQLGWRLAKWEEAKEIFHRQLKGETPEKKLADLRKKLEETDHMMRTIGLTWIRAGTETRFAKAIRDYEELLGEMPGRKRKANLELLEETVNIVYYKIGYARKRVKELEKLIDETRTKLKEYIDEKETLSQDDSDIYSYFHDLLGGEELEKLDKEFFY